MPCFMYEVIVTTHCSSTSVYQCSWLVYGEITSDSNIGVGAGSVPDPEQAHFHVKVVKQGV